jgi:hypothetical protein
LKKKKNPANFIIIDRIENDKFKISMKKKDEDLASVKGALERFTNAVSIF